MCSCLPNIAGQSFGPDNLSDPPSLACGTLEKAYSSKFFLSGLSSVSCAFLDHCQLGCDWLKSWSAEVVVN